jgi:hypothetical protein
MNVQLLRFPGIILKVLRLEVSIYNVYITNYFQTTFAQGGGESALEVTVNSKGENYVPITSKNSASGLLLRKVLQFLRDYVLAKENRRSYRKCRLCISQSQRVVGLCRLTIGLSRTHGRNLLFCQTYTVKLSSRYTYRTLSTGFSSVIHSSQIIG